MDEKALAMIGILLIVIIAAAAIVLPIAGVEAIGKYYTPYTFETYQPYDTCGTHGTQDTCSASGCEWKPVTYGCFATTGTQAVGEEPEAQAAVPGGFVRLTTCVNITQPDEYRLTDDINYTGNDSCFEILSDDVTLDCNGKRITNVGNNVGDGTAILLRNVKNVKVKNCIVNGFAYGIRLANANFSEVTNNEIINSNPYAIALHSGSDSNKIVENDIVGRGDIQFLNAQNTEMSGNIACDAVFYCEEHVWGFSDGTFSNALNQFDNAESCADGWPVLNVDYTAC